MNNIVNQALEDSNLPQVICIGEALLDRLGPLGGDPLIDKPVEDRLGGAPANVACCLAKLGIQSAFCGRLGADFIGKDFQNLFKARGVNFQGLQIDDQRPSRIVLVHRDETGERSFQGFVGDIGMGFADQAFSFSDLLQPWSGLIPQAIWLLVGTIPLASRTSEEALLRSIDEAHTSGIQLALDINWRSTFWDLTSSPESGPTKNDLKKIAPLLEKADLLKLANEEALWFFNSNDPWKISSSLSKRPDVVITDGAKPVCWSIAGFGGEMEAFAPPSVVDTTGAGDAFTAGLIYKLLSFELDQLSKQIAEEIIQFANACGSHVCKGLGAIDSQPYLQDIDDLLSFSNGGMS